MPAVKEEKGTSTDHVIAGVASRCVTEAFMSPFNLVKVRLQNNPDLARGYGSISEAFYHVTREEGLYGIYRGLPPRLLWTAPLAAFTFLFVSSNEVRDAAGLCGRSEGGDSFGSGGGIACVRTPLPLALHPSSLAHPFPNGLPLLPATDLAFSTRKERSCWSRPRGRLAQESCISSGERLTLPLATQIRMWQ